MRFLLSSLIVILLGIQSSQVTCQQHITCTNGRIFMTDQSTNILHAVDTDDGEIYDVDVVGTAPHMLVTTSGLIVSSYGGTSAEQNKDGVTQFFHPGLLFESHQDHWDVHKELPFSYAYQITNMGGNIQSTSHNNYIGIFYGSNDVATPSTATFVKQDEIATSTTPTTISITPKDAQQQILPSVANGIAVALSSTRFLVSVENGFTIVDQNGIEVFNLHNTSNPDGHCVNYAKTSMNNDEYINTCGSNIFTIIYHAATDVVQTKTILDANIQHITSNAIDNLFIGYQSSTSTLYRFGATMDSTLVVPSTQMYTYDNVTSQPCGIYYEASDHHHGIVFWPTGRLDVIIPSPLELEHSFTVGTFNGEQSVCDTISLTFGHGIVYVVDRVNQIMYTVNIEVEDAPIPTTTLPFVPATIALYYDERAQCVDGGNEHAHDHDHDDDHDHDTPSSTATPGNYTIVIGNDTTGTIAPPDQCVMVCTCQHPSTSSVPVNGNININVATSSSSVSVSSSIIMGVIAIMTFIRLI